MDSGKLPYSLLMLTVLVAAGTIGYYVFERMSFFDAFYMTIITLSTVGFSEIVPLTKVGRSITVVIIILGISVGTYTTGIIVQWLVGGELQKVFGRRKLQKQIAVLRNHFIICGFGRIGHVIGQELFMEEAELGPSSGLVGKNLIERGLRQDFGVIIVAIKKISGQMIFNPARSQNLESGDVIVVIGQTGDLKRMRGVL
jgi:hypothetical protein